MLVDICYAFSLLLQHSTLKEKCFGEGPLIDVLWSCSGSAPRRIWPKIDTNERGLEYFIPTKFGEYPSSDSVVKSDYVFQDINMH